MRSAIESMSGLKVEEIAVYIDGILGTESGSDQARLDKEGLISHMRIGLFTDSFLPIVDGVGRGGQ